MADVLILAAGTAAAPTDYEVPNAQVVLPKAVHAVFDGTGASGSYVPVLEILSDSGIPVATCPLASTLAAGASAEVSWFPLGAAGTQSAAAIAVVGARIYAPNFQTIPTGAINTDLVYTSVDFDTDGMANLAANNKILTVNTAGLYLVACETPWTYNSAGRRLSGITHNGLLSVLGAFEANDSRMATWAPVGGDGGGGPRTSTISFALIDAQVGDFFASGAIQFSGGNLTCNGQQRRGYLSAVLMGSL